MHIPRAFHVVPLTLKATLQIAPISRTGEYAVREQSASIKRPYADRRASPGPPGHCGPQRNAPGGSRKGLPGGAAAPVWGSLVVWPGRVDTEAPRLDWGPFWSAGHQGLEATHKVTGQHMSNTGSPVTAWRRLNWCPLNVRTGNSWVKGLLAKPELHRDEDGDVFF